MAFEQGRAVRPGLAQHRLGDRDRGFEVPLARSLGGARSATRAAPGPRARTRATRAALRRRFDAAAAPAICCPKLASVAATPGSGRRVGRSGAARGARGAAWRGSARPRAGSGGGHRWCARPRSVPVRPAPQLRAGRAERTGGDLERDVLVRGARGTVIREALQDPCRALERAEQRVEHGRIELESAFGAHHLGGDRDRAGGAVWAVGRDRIERVGDGGDPARQRDRVLREAARVARPVEALVMRPRDHRRGGVELGARAVQQRAPDLGVTVQPPTFGVAQRSPDGRRSASRSCRRHGARQRGRGRARRDPSGHRSARTAPPPCAGGQGSRARRQR